jgi:hypothetical protein
MRILALTKYGSLAASTRQRFVQYEPALAAAGITVDYAPLLGNEHINRLVAERPARPLAVLRSYTGRLRSLVAAGAYDALWVHCELFPYWPGFTERLVKWPGKPIVFDYDDAIFHMYDSSPRPVIRRLLGRKLAPLLSRVDACCCGNDYLQDYARQFCSRSMVLPTVVDTTRYCPVGKLTGLPTVIGWIGSPSTWPFMRPLLPLLRELREEYGVVIRVVGAGSAAERDRFSGLELVRWSEASEIAAVQAMDVGIMPVPDGPFERGKSGYKLIQYMACGLPVVASPVGVNKKIVEPGRSGYLARSSNDWRGALVNLITNPDLRATLGHAGRDRIVADFSLETHAPRLVQLFQSFAPVEAR